MHPIDLVIVGGAIGVFLTFTIALAWVSRNPRR